MAIVPFSGFNQWYNPVFLNIGKLALRLWKKRTCNFLKISSQRGSEETVEGLLKSEESPADPLDRASLESNRSTTLRIRDKESMLIKKIRKSLEDIENGDYGICEDCGEDISIERFKARPVTSFCIRCKTKRESL